jgi:N-acetylglucosaminyl-diphospho-decaprenol L-rhamnosyltransferase
MTYISIVLVNYNGQRFLKDCLTSIIEQVQNIDYEVIIVDNSSADDSVKIIQNNFLDFKLICSDSNLGFGKANNLGVKRSQGEYLLFLNTDTILTENTPKILADYLIANQDVGAVGSRLTFKDGSYQLSCGRFPNLVIEFIYKIRAGLDYRWHQVFSVFYDHLYAKFTDVDWVTGACFMMHRDIFNKLGGFDESFFMYFEDVDLCKRIKDLGLKVVYYPQTTVIHLLGGSAQGGKKGINVHYRNSQIHYYQKHLSKLQVTILKLYLQFSGKV